MANQMRATVFRHPEIGSFFQAQPKLENPFIADGFLRRTLIRMLPAEVINCSFCKPSAKYLIYNYFLQVR